MSRAEEALVRAVAGDLAGVRDLRNVPPDEWRGLSQASKRLEVTAGAVRRVLEALRAHEIAHESAEEWAGLMRWGTLGRWREVSAGSVVDAGRPMVPLELSFEASKEAAIVEALARLDEIADVGFPSEAEIADLLEAMA
jgi:hypothetical protein